MVTPQIPTLVKTSTQEAFQTSLPIPKSGCEDCIPSNDEEFDFSDVFGPSITPLDSEACDVNPETVAVSDGNGLVYDDPVVIYKRSHSLVGPSVCVSSQSLKSVEGQLSYCVHKMTIEESFGSSSDEDMKDVEEEIEDEQSVRVGRVGLDNFEVMKVVGKGAFGKVYQVRKNGTGEIYAMKVMRKDQIMEHDHADYMKAERDILTKVDHPFIVTLRYSFQTKYRLYLVFDFINGGHLFFQLYNQGLFREELARIYAAEIISAVSHLHIRGIMHRDLKPENILLDSEGHVVLTDFGVAKEFKENERSNSMCGTVEYMAPEIVLGKGHDKAADWWSVGILVFEMLTGKPPFIGGNRDKIQQKIIKDKIKLPTFLTSEAHSLLKALLQKEPGIRLGSGPTGVDGIKRHKWFKPINWKKLDAREIQPSFRPQVSGKMCIANFEKCWTDMPPLDSPANSPNAKGNLIFKDFSYVRPTGNFLQKPSPLNDHSYSAESTS